jgi:hypothetical protein
MIIVANKRKPMYRGPIGFDPPYFYIGRPEVLGNPYVIGEDGTRDDVIDKYRIWLREEYVSNNKVYYAVERLVTLYLNGTSTTLVCWCAPAKCHGDVIKEFVEELANAR